LRFVFTPWSLRPITRSTVGGAHHASKAILRESLISHGFPAVVERHDLSPFRSYEARN